MVPEPHAERSAIKPNTKHGLIMLSPRAGSFYINISAISSFTCRLTYLRLKYDKRPQVDRRNEASSELPASKLVLWETTHGWGKRTAGLRDPLQTDQRATHDYDHDHDCD